MSSNHPRSIYAIDVGSTRDRKGRRPAFTWACVRPDQTEICHCCHDIDHLTRSVETDLQSGRSVAIGFEAPLFIPVPESSKSLSSGRPGEGNRSWAAPVGLAVTTLGLHQAAWILQRMVSTCRGLADLTLDANRWPPREGKPVLFLWEAFVSGDAHGRGEHPDELDAATAVTCFLDNEEKLTAGAPPVVTPAGESRHQISLIGAAALWAGWSEDLDLLRTSTLILKPQERCPVHPVACPEES